MGWKEYYGYRNQIWFDRTYGTNLAVRKLRPVFLVLDLGLRAVIRHKWRNFKVIKKAYLDGIHDRLGITVKPGTSNEKFSEGIVKDNK